MRKKRTAADIARKLGVPPKKFRRWLREAAYRKRVRR